VWFQDEARIGQKNSLTRVWGQTGSRPAAPKDLGFASAYVFGAVCPSQGKAAALIMPICNTAAMNHHLSEISSQVAADAHAVVILDGAGWHRSQGLAVPGNVTLLELPPYSPELNPVERIWHYLRSHWLANSVFPSLADIMDCLRDGLEPVCRRSRPDPLALRRRLGCGFARSVGAALSNRRRMVKGSLGSRNFRRPVLVALWGGAVRSPDPSGRRRFRLLPPPRRPRVQPTALR
jgi:hypothetical protein